MGAGGGNRLAERQESMYEPAYEYIHKDCGHVGFVADKEDYERLKDKDAPVQCFSCGRQSELCDFTKSEVDVNIGNYND